jgi:hypothetical protein
MLVPKSIYHRFIFDILYTIIACRIKALTNGIKTTNYTLYNNNSCTYGRERGMQVCRYAQYIGIGRQSSFSHRERFGGLASPSPAAKDSGDESLAARRVADKLFRMGYSISGCLGVSITITR